MPFGNFEPPFNLPHLAASCGATYVARWTSLHIRRLTKSFTEAIHRKGFRFIEVIAPCSTLYARLNKLGTGLDLMRFYHDNAEIRHGADTRDVGHRLPGQDHLRQVRRRGEADLPRADERALPEDPRRPVRADAAGGRVDP